MKFVRKFFAFTWKNKTKILKWTGYVAFAGFVFIAFLFIYYSKDLPSKDTVNDLFVPESTKILDRTGTSVLYDIYDEYNRTIIARDQMPENIRNATVVAEDSSFYHHKGLDFKGIVRAFFKNIKGGGIRQGGSTITQQYVKNLLLSPERTFTRKIKEAVLAIEMEFVFSKDEILTGYLNYVPYGSNAYGVEAAAKTYFDKTARDLTLAEAATLSALPQAPTYYSNNLDALFARQENILNKMLQFGYITEQDHALALEEEVNFRPKYNSLQSPHFVIMVRQYLETTYGVDFVQQAGLNVITTLDKTLQDAAESAVRQYADTNASNFNAHNAALVSLDPKTGQILAMVGSKRFFGESYPENCVPGRTCLFDPQVNVAITPQQPGSSFKPFAYAVALQKGYTLDTVIYDVPTEFNTNCPWTANQEKDSFGLGCYNPQNYDGQFFGPITLKEALAQSRNVPSVKVLYLAGLEDTIKFAQDAGITSLRDPARYGLSLVLGGGDVSLLEEVSAYGAFATRGEYNPPSYILRIEDKNGNVLEEFNKNSKTVLDERVANKINHALSVNEYRARTFGQQNHLNISGLPVAAKTGTTQGFRDGWTVGYTNSMVAGVWVGNNNNSSMRNNASGSQVAAPIWNSFMRTAYAEKAKESDTLKDKEFYFRLPAMSQETPFVEPATEKTGKDVLDGIARQHNTILHYVNKNNPRADGTSTNDPMYSNWQNAVQNWARINNLLFRNDNDDDAVQINFLSPAEKFFDDDEDLDITAEIFAPDGLEYVRLRLDGRFITEETYAEGITETTLIYSAALSGLKKGKHTITVEVKNIYDIVKQKTIDFIIN